MAADARAEEYGDHCGGGGLYAAGRGAGAAADEHEYDCEQLARRREGGGVNAVEAGRARRHRGEEADEDLLA